MNGPSTDDVRRWLRAIERQTVTAEMVNDLILSLESALDFIDEMAGVTSKHPLYPGQ